MENVESPIEKKPPMRREAKFSRAAMPAKGQKVSGKRASPLSGVLRKLTDLSAQAVETAIRDAARNTDEHARVRALFNVVLSGAVTTLLKNSTLLTEDDRAFLRELGYLPKPAKEAA